MNGQYLSMLPADELLMPVRLQLERSGVSLDGRDLRPIIDAVKARSRTVLNVADQVAVRLDPDRAQLDEKGAGLIRKMGPAFSLNLMRAANALAGIASEEWKPDRLVDTLKRVAETDGLKLGEVMQPVRVALTGSTVSEPVNELLAVVGKERSLSRLRAVAAKWADGGCPA
jgi:glutamyl-tRNA synthetase